MEYWPGVHLVEGSRLSHVYLVMEPSITLIDTAPPGTLDQLLHGLHKIHVRPRDIKRIILTHCDIDHIGNASSLQLVTDAEVCAHEDDIAAITGAAPLPGPFVRQLLGATWGRRVVHPRIDRPLHDGDSLEGLQVVHLPGHTPGHIGLKRESVLIGGDVLFGGRRPRPSPPPLTWSRHHERCSLERIGEMEIDLLLPGHGTPVNDGSRVAQELAARIE